jgi:ribosome-associated protein
VAEPDGLRVAPGVVVPASELLWRFSTAGGPGGQHVNTSNTRAEVIFDVAHSPSLPEAVRDRLTARLGPVVTVAASDRRSQVRNRDLALARLEVRLRDALHEDRPRRPTRPTAASARRRLDAKRRRAETKRQRRGGGGSQGRGGGAADNSDE